jgi:hypothetical protein
MFGIFGDIVPAVFEDENMKTAQYNFKKPAGIAILP